MNSRIRRCATYVAVGLSVIAWLAAVNGEDFPEINISVSNPEVNPGQTFKITCWVEKADESLKRPSIVSYSVQQVGYFHRGLKRNVIMSESGSKAGPTGEGFSGLEGSLGRGRYTYEEGTKVGFTADAQATRIGMYLIETQWYCDSKDGDESKKVKLRSAPILVYITPYDKEGRLIKKFAESEEHRSFEDLRLQEEWEKRSLNTLKE